MQSQMKDQVRETLRRASWLRVERVIAIMALAWAVPASASVTPGACATDEHVRCAVYDVTTSYRVPYRLGEAVVIQFEPGETVDDPASGLGTGVPSGWSVAGQGNWFMFKPAIRKADTNFVIVTSRRRYVFSFETATRGEVALWSLSFDYPDTRAKADAAAKAKADRARAVADGGTGDAVDVSESGSGRRNDDYDMKGDIALAPTALWDDGRFTYFQYDTSRQTPEIYRILADGTEAVPSRHVDGDTIVIQDTAPGFVLRLGKTVLAVRNNGYSPDGTFNRSGTTVPGWVRVLKGKAKDSDHG